MGRFYYSYIKLYINYLLYLTWLKKMLNNECEKKIGNPVFISGKRGLWV